MPHDIRKKIFIIAILLLFVGTTVPYSTFGASPGDPQEDSPNVAITINNIEHGTRVEYHIHEFSMENIIIEGEEYSHIILDGGSNTLVKDMPDLPSICRSIIVPENVKMNVKIVRAQYIQYDEIAIVPSKGNLLRAIDPKDVPYEFGDIYTDNTWYPQDIAELGEPYILRDFCGQVVKITPFQYNPVQKQLRFYTDILIEIYPVEPDTMNEYIQYDTHQLKIDADLTDIYENQFINFNTLYAPLEEHGHMLIITYDSFWSAMVPFMQWKNMKGIQTEMVKVSEIGNATAIKNYIAQYYHTHGLTYVLLVGDAAQVPTIMVSGYASDPSYSYIVGDDHYPDVFVGRFSAETTGDVETQVTRTINYEKYPQLQAEWYHNGTGIASNQGTGDDNEYDWQHMRNIRTDLMGYHYTKIDEFYDGTHNGEDTSGNPTPSMISAAVNNGRGIINYCGHGSATAWGTSAFSTTDIAALTNDNMLPFIFSVACLNGQFESSTCFAEAWMRATHNNEPTGAIAAFMSSKIQAWNPPMDAQDEIIDLLIESYAENKKNTFGGLAFTGCMRMNDDYGSSGYAETDAWHVFGDPSLQVRTDTPEAMTVEHNPGIPEGSSTFEVNVPGVEDALCALSRDFILLGTGYTNATGHAVIHLDNPLSGIEDVDLVVTAYNKIPYTASIIVTDSNPPATPSQPEGPQEGDINEAYIFSVEGVMEPEHQDVFYLFDWGDGLNTGWLGPFPSGEGPVEAIHKWKERGYYQVTVKAKDPYDKESGFSEPLVMNIGQRLEIGAITGGFGIKVPVKSTLPLSKYVDYTIEIAGGSFSGLHVNKYFNDTIYVQSGTTETVKTPPFFAFGKVKITVTARCSGEPVVTATNEAIVWFFYVTNIQKV